MATLIITLLFMALSFVGIGVGALFFKKGVQPGDCTRVPGTQHEDCPSQRMGLCPIEDRTGMMSLAYRSRLDGHH